MKPTVHQNYASQDQKLTTPKSKDKSLEKTGLPIKGRLENAHVHALRHSAYRWHIHFPKKLIEQRFKFGLPHHETHTHTITIQLRLPISHFNTPYEEMIASV